MGKRVNLTDERVRELASKYEAGATLKTLADEVGCSVPTLANRLRGVVTLRGRGRAKGTAPKVASKSFPKPASGAVEPTRPASVPLVPPVGETVDTPNKDFVSLSKGN